MLRISIPGTVQNTVIFSTSNLCVYWHGREAGWQQDEPEDGDGYMGLLLPDHGNTHLSDPMTPIITGKLSATGHNIAP